MIWIGLLENADMFCVVYTRTDPGNPKFFMYFPDHNCKGSGFKDFFKPQRLFNTSIYL